MTGTELRARLLAACDRIGGETRFRDEAGRQIARGVGAARAAIERIPEGLALRDFVQAAHRALDVARAPFAADPHDDDGWALGGIASIRALLAEDSPL